MSIADLKYLVYEEPVATVPLLTVLYSCSCTQDRDMARKLHEEAGLAFFECYVNTPLAICESRDPKGLYKKVRRGEIKGFTGIDQSYEEPLNCELVIKSGEMSVDECVQSVISLLQQRVCRRVSVQGGPKNETSLVRPTAATVQNKIKWISLKCSWS